MQNYLGLVMLLNFIVDLLLLMGTNRIAGCSQVWGRQIIAAGVGAIYSGACLLPGFSFLGNFYWRIIFLVLMGLVSFGFYLSALRKSILFVVLSFALGGFAQGLEQRGFMGIVCSAAFLCFLCFLGFGWQFQGPGFVPVELFYKDNKMSLLAMQDTGNTLRDPVTGQRVMVASAEVGMQLLGLTREQLAMPVETVASGVIPGLRLLPFRTVGQESGLLLTAKLDKVVIGKQEGAPLVAFSPERLDREGMYQALTGGITG